MQKYLPHICWQDWNRNSESHELKDALKWSLKPSGEKKAKKQSALAHLTMLWGTKEPKDLSYFSFSRMGKKQGKQGISDFLYEDIQEGIISTRWKEKEKTYIPVVSSGFVEL